MKLLLVQPPLAAAREVQPPLGLCMLAACARQHGHDVRILDLDLEGKLGASGGTDYLERFAAELERYRPAVVGVTSMFNNSLHAERLLRTAKCRDPQVVTVAGGSHFGALPRAALERIPELDFVVRGEGEAGLTGLLAALGTDELAGRCPEPVPADAGRNRGECRRPADRSGRVTADLGNAGRHGRRGALRRHDPARLAA